ncbi:hypothetical protein J6A31_05830 [bacterium]|nr:hypothetical protein [bacterium]
MKYEPKYPCYVKYGVVFAASSDISLIKPAVLVNGEDDMILKWGNYDSLIPHLNKFVDSHILIGEDPDNVKLIDLSYLTAEEQCYIINRMMTHSASGFVRNLVNRLSDETAKEWLASEMARLPQPLVVKGDD